jgi:hypothetical protein
MNNVDEVKERTPMPTLPQSLVIQRFQTVDLAKEFLNYSRVEIERLHNTGPDFEESLYQEAVDLVLRRLQHSAGGDAQ